MGSSDKDIDESEFTVLTTKLNDNTEMRGVGFRVKILVLFAILLAVVTIICSFLMATRGSGNMLAKQFGGITSVEPKYWLAFNVPILQSDSTMHILADDSENTAYAGMLPEAALYTSEGESEATRIRTGMNKQIAIKISASYFPVEKTICAEKTESALITPEVYNKSEKEKFYEFVRVFDTLKIAFDEAESN